MLLVCPECDQSCTVDEISAEAATCPGCGFLLFSGTKQPRAADTNAGAPEPAYEQSSPTSDYETAAKKPLPTAEQLPQELGRYTLTQLLGRGGFAHVYRAFDSQLGRDVALKLPRRDWFSTKQQLLLFLEEARVCAKLEHPGIVRIYDVGWLTEDICYISMELCPGGSMDALVKRPERVPPHRAAELVADLADAIHRAHVNGLVHRDLKPSNILFGADGRPRIADFGLAMPEERLLDRPGEVAGTLPYMSPEQVRGEAHLLDGRSDIWSLGAILYQLLVGRRPFLGELQQLREQILKREPKPLRQVVDEIPAELEQICLKCLRKDTSERWATAKDLARELRNWRDASRSQSAAAGPVWLPAPLASRPAWWRSSLAQGALVTSLVCLIGFLAVALSKGESANTGKAETSAVGASSSTSAPSNWQLDQGVPLRKYALFVTPPRRLVWPIPGESTSLDYSAEEAKVSISSAPMTLAELGMTKAANYDLAVDLYRSAPTGSTGLFWGFRTTPDEETYAQCYAMYFKTYLRRLGDTSVDLIVVSRLRIHRYDNGELAVVQQDELTSEAVDPLTEQGGVLILRTSASGLSDARWNGKALTPMCDRLAREERFSQPGNPPYRPQGGFGLLNESGNSLYRNATFTLRNGTAP